MAERATYRNPILPGFHPDPSICRVGDDFYLVNSSFAYFPGIPIYHSRDLARWEQIGNALDRPSQLPLEGAGISRGLFAPTIRHSRGTFYIACTNVDNGGNFIVTARDPAGPWSEPRWLRNAPGIDPSLFFDDDPASSAAAAPSSGGDGRAWYCGTRPVPEGERYSGNWEVWLQELDARSLELIGEPIPLWRGALRECVWPEGPHIYRRGGWYYLMIAEGGTGPDHAITIARSRSIAGPYEGKRSNPILTHRHLGAAFPITNVGHGDLVEDPNGDWWMTLLACRPIRGFSVLGRETFMVPVAWEDDWPLPCPGVGKVEEAFEAPRLPRFDAGRAPDRDDFDAPKLAPRWLSLRGPAEAFSSLSERPGFLRLRLLPSTLREREAVSFVALRQLDASYAAVAAMEFEPRAEGESAGLALVQSEDCQYRLEVALSQGRKVARLVAVEPRGDGAGASPGAERVIAEKPCAAGPIILSATSRYDELRFSFGPPAATESLAAGIDGTLLSTERAGGFVGTTIGMFASSGGRPSVNAADFDWFVFSSPAGASD
jgi:xylan 1,4-beta-xylosidase